MQKKRCRPIFMPEGVFCSHCNFPAEQAQVAAVALSLEFFFKNCIYSIFISGPFQVFNVAFYISFYTNNRMHLIFYAFHTSVHRRPHHYKDGQNASSIKLNQHILIALWSLEAV